MHTSTHVASCTATSSPTTCSSQETVSRNSATLARQSALARYVPIQQLPPPSSCISSIPQVLTRGRGTYAFNAPELFTRPVPTAHPANDIWALGVTYFAMLTNELPWTTAVMSDSSYSTFVIHGVIKSAKWERFTLAKKKVCPIQLQLSLHHSFRIHSFSDQCSPTTPSAPIYSS